MNKLKEFLKNEAVQKAIQSLVTAALTLLFLWSSIGCCSLRAWHFDTNTKIESETNYNQER